MAEPLLALHDLTIEVRSGRNWLPVVEDLSLDVGRHEVLGLVGESGSGKSLTALAVMGLLPAGRVRIVRGTAVLDGRDLLALPRRRLDDVRGAEVAMVFQDPLTSLNPRRRVGPQVAEPLVRHRGLSRHDARAAAVEWLGRVGLRDPERVAGAYPFELSGGMRQRVAIATALTCGPRLLLADEPTTALDVTVQSGILRLLRDLQAGSDLSVLLVSHDLAVVAELCDRVAVMYAGQLVEVAPAGPLFDRPRSPYTEALVRAQPRLVETGEIHWVEGRPPTPAELAATTGCRFAPRCPHARAECRDQSPPLAPAPGAEGEGGGGGHAARAVRCRRAGELVLKGVEA